jgi:hypothetical protein
MRTLRATGREILSPGFSPPEGGYLRHYDCARSKLLASAKKVWISRSVVGPHCMLWVTSGHATRSGLWDRRESAKGAKAALFGPLIAPFGYKLLNHLG